MLIHVNIHSFLPASKWSESCSCHKFLYVSFALSEQILDEFIANLLDENFFVPTQAVFLDI